MGSRSITYASQSLITAPKIPTDLLWGLTLLFVAIGVLYFAGIFYFRRRESLESKAMAKRKRELSPILSEFLFFEENAPKDEKTNYVKLKIEIRELLRNPRNRKILTVTLMDLQKDLSGSVLIRLYGLFKNLGLHNDSYEKLKSWRWQTVSKGIVELTQMRVEESYSLMTKFINDKRPTVRKQAEIGIISLNDVGINYFLDTTVHKISEWQQLKILEVLKNKKNFLPPSFKSWLVSTNNDVVLFALRLMKHYVQSDGNEALIELLRHKNNKVRSEAIGCIKEFHVTEAVETLKLVFWDSSIDIKIDILDAISVLGSLQDIEFLKSIGVKQSNFNVRSKALAVINVLAPMTVMPTKDVQDVSKFKVPKDIFSTDAVNYRDRQTDMSHDELGSRNLEGQDSQGHQRQQDKTPETLETEIQNPNKEARTANEADAEPLKPLATDLSPDAKRPVDRAPERYDPVWSLEEGATSVLEYPVEYEMVSHEGSNAPERSESNADVYRQNREPDPISLDFLPIVVGIEPKEEMVPDRHVPGTYGVSDLNVTYSELRANPIKPKENTIVALLGELVPLGGVGRTSGGNGPNPDSNIPKTLNHIDMKKVVKIYCEGIEIKVVRPRSTEKNREGVASTEAEAFELLNEPQAQNTLEWVMAENEAQTELKKKIRSIAEKKESTEFEIPKPVFTNEFEYETIELLDHVEVLGDKREVPLLQEMLQDERIKSLNGRIESLIQRISGTSVLSRNRLQWSSDRRAPSVFQQFFKALDIKSRLIMLDDIVAIGDEKEVEFLQGLVNHTNTHAKVRQKARDCLEMLKTKLHEEIAETVDRPETNDIESEAGNPEQHRPEPIGVFDIDFELEFDNEEFQDRKST